MFIKIRDGNVIMNTRMPWQHLLQCLPLLAFVGFFVMGWCLYLSFPKRDRGPAEADLRDSTASVIAWPARQPDPLSLANSETARRLHLSPEHRLAIARIDAELDRIATLKMEAALKRWQQRGGFHVEPIPNFRDRRSFYGSELTALKWEAKERITSILSPDERRRWLNQPPPIRRLQLSRSLDQEIIPYSPGSYE